VGWQPTNSIVRLIDRLTNLEIASQLSERAKRIWGADLGINFQELKAIHEKEKD